MGGDAGSASLKAKPKDLYKVLGVDRSASADQIRKAYRRLATELHPDKQPGSADSDSRFAAVTEAYGILSNPQQRRLYDDTGSITHSGTPVLHCSHCLGKAGVFSAAQIPLAVCPDGLITNTKAKLYCYDRPLPTANHVSLPNGTYLDSCFGCAASSEVIHCEVCLDDDGERILDVSAPAAHCTSFGFSEDGVLFCETSRPLLARSSRSGCGERQFLSGSL